MEILVLEAEIKVYEELLEEINSLGCSYSTAYKYEQIIKKKEAEIQYIKSLKK